MAVIAVPVTFSPGAVGPIGGSLDIVTELDGTSSSALSGSGQAVVDGLAVLSRAVAIAPRALVGFTAATGGLTDRHAVSNLSITGFPAPSL